MTALRYTLFELVSESNKGKFLINEKTDYAWCSRRQLARGSLVFVMAGSWSRDWELEGTVYKIRTNDKLTNNSRCKCQISAWFRARLDVSQRVLLDHPPSFSFGLSMGLASGAPSLRYYFTDYCIWDLISYGKFIQSQKKSFKYPFIFKMRSSNNTNKQYHSKLV